MFSRLSKHKLALLQGKRCCLVFKAQSSISSHVGEQKQHKGTEAWFICTLTVSKSVNADVLAKNPWDGSVWHWLSKCFRGLHLLYAMQVKSLIKVSFLHVIHKTCNFFPKQTLSSLLATCFVRMCEVSMPQDSSVHGGIPAGSRFSSGDAHLLSLSFSLEDGQEPKSVCSGRAVNSC